MFVDLSMPVNEKTIVFPGDTLPQFEKAGTLETTSFVDHVIHVNNHLGTHIDAPGHMVAGGKVLKDYGLERFILPAICVDVRGKTKLTAELVKDLTIAEGSAVLLCTGTSDRYQQQSYAEDYPEIDQSLVEALVEMKVKVVGVDMISFDHHEPFPIHVGLLSNDILLIENLVNLDKVTGKSFKLYAAPINFQLEAAPARVFAEVAS